MRRKREERTKKLNTETQRAQRRFARLALTRRVTALGIILPNNAQKARRYRGRIATYRDASLCLCVSVFKFFLYVASASGAERLGDSKRFANPWKEGITNSGRCRLRSHHRWRLTPSGRHLTRGIPPHERLPQVQSKAHPGVSLLSKFF